MREEDLRALRAQAEAAFGGKEQEEKKRRSDDGDDDGE